MRPLEAPAHQPHARPRPGGGFAAGHLSAGGARAGYHGGELRAWLAAIAKNAFYSHHRKRYLSVEVSLDLDEEQAQPEPGIDPHLLADLRQAVGDLSPVFRDALVMKHYGGFSYQEIAERQQCAVGTAKSRVSTAIGHLRASLTCREEEELMPIPITRLLDYLYGRLTDKEAAAVRAQLAKNTESQAELQAMEQILRGLDALESEVKIVEIAVLDAEGGVTRYDFFNATAGESSETAEEADWTLTDNIELRAVLLQGQDVPLRKVGEGDNVINYKSPFPRPVQPGEPLGPALVVTYERNGVKAGELPDDPWEFSTGGTLKSNSESWVFVQVVRLPPGATMVNIDPPANQVRQNAAPTVIWQHVSTAVAPNAPGEWKVGGSVTYTLP
ncbi:MAG: sigma factor-like helix-turn-helix DNA-binding protein [Armatimonadota bacterium]